MKKWILRTGLALLIFLFVVGFSNRKTDLYENMVNATVLIQGHGSGVFIHDNVILTAAHVLEGGSTCKIELSDGTVLRSNDFYIDTEEDVGFIFVDTDELHIVEVSSLQNNIGDTVYLVGRPHDDSFKFSLTKGILSHLDRDILYFNWKDLLQTDAEGGPGSSGGPMYDSEGRVIGMYVGHTYSGGVGVSLCEDAKSILEAYERCMNARSK